jgi:hypothetical protein
MGKRQSEHWRERSDAEGAVGFPQAPQNWCVRSHSTIWTARPAVANSVGSMRPNRRRRPEKRCPGGGSASGFSSAEMQGVPSCSPRNWERTMSSPSKDAGSVFSNVTSSLRP